MKTVKISDIEEATEVDNSYENDDSFERLFYNVINVFAYSKFYDVSANPQVFGSLKYVDLVKGLYKNFEEKKGFFSGKQELETYQKIILIIDEFCVEKFKKFIYKISFGEDDYSINKAISEFINDNNKNIEDVSDECRKKTHNKYIEYLMKDLQTRNPQKFKELIDFEINRKELKDSSDKIRLTIGDFSIKPSSIFLNEIKKHSNLEKSSSKSTKHNYFCAIS